jgi:hypothetical protein
MALKFAVINLGFCLPAFEQPAPEWQMRPDTPYLGNSPPPPPSHAKYPKSNTVYCSEFH